MSQCVICGDSINAEKMNGGLAIGKDVILCNKTDQGHYDFFFYSLNKMSVLDDPKFWERIEDKKKLE